MASERRIEKLNILIKEELSKIIDRELEFDNEEIITITRVAVSPDKHYASVFISLLSPGPKNLLEKLQKNIYNIQQGLNKRLRMRPVPKISFKIDMEEIKRERVEKSLAELKKRKEI